MTYFATFTIIQALDKAVFRREASVMKRQFAGPLFALLICAASVNGFCQEVNFMPLTWEIVKNERNNLHEADFYLSKTFSIKQDGENNVKSGFQNGTYVINEENASPQTIKFTQGETKGNFVKLSDLAAGGEVLEISFPERNIRLRFARNMTKDRFELASAVVNAKNYTFLIHDEPPYLTVKTITKASSVPSGRYDVIYISGQGSLNKSVIISYIRHRNIKAPSNTVESLIDAYFWAAGRERINPDVAIAQMCQATDFLSNVNAMQTHNYAGFLPTPEWPGSFTGGMRQGVIAHIQHLKGYASNARPGDLADPLADPQWNALGNARGTARTLEELSRKWAPYNSKGYENEIRDIIYDMRLFTK
jgi:hypothetical protein